MRRSVVRITGVLGVVILVGVGLSQFLFNQRTVKGMVEGYLRTTFQSWADPDNLTIQWEDFHWGGLTHPFSFEASHLDIQGFKEDFHLQGGPIRISLKTVPLVFGKIEFSRLHGEHLQLHYQNKLLMDVNVRLHRSWQGKNLILDGVCDVASVTHLSQSPIVWPHIHKVQLNANMTFHDSQIVGNEVRLQRDNTKAYGSFQLESDRPWVDLWRQGGHVEVKVTSHANDIAVNDIAHFWPEVLAPKPRTWVTQNLEKGAVPLATMNMASHIQLSGQGHVEEVKLTHLGGEIEVQGVTVHYLKPMMPVLEAKGNCKYTDKHFHIEASGHVHGIQLTEGTILISDLDQKDQMMDIHLKNEGPVEKCLQLLASEPLDLTKHLGIDSTNIKGHAVVDTVLRFPLMLNLPLDQVHVTAKADLHKSEIHLSQGLGQRLPVTDGEFKLDVTNDHFNLTGQTKIAHWPSTLTWEQYFDEQKSSCQQRLAIKSRLEWPESEDWGGVIPVECTYESHFSGKSQGHLQANFDQFTINVPSILWDKKRGQEARGTLRWSMNGKKGVIDSLEVTGPDVLVQAHGDFDSHGVKGINFSSFKIGDLRPQVTMTRKLPELYQLGVHLDTFDLSALIHDLDALTQGDGDFSLPFEVAFSLTIDQLLASDNFKLRNVHSDVRWVRDRLGLVEVKATTIPDHSPFVFRLTPTQSQGKQELNLQTSRAGELLELFGTGYDMEGGDMIMVGHKTDHNGSWLLQGEVQLKKLVVRQAPLLAHLLSVTSFQGIIHLFTGKGIQFSHGHTRFNLSPTKLEFTQSELSGAALGVFFQGHVNRLTHEINFNGELVPIYGVNQLMASVPLVGKALSGGNQEGIFRTAFTVTGSKESPEISVNALTSITPGGVRAAIKAGQKAIRKVPQPLGVPSGQSPQP